MVRFRRSGAVAAVAMAALQSGCDEESQTGPPPLPPRADWVTHRDRERGFAVSFPPPWRRATRSLTPKLTEPRELFSLGTYRLRYRPTNCEAFAGGAREDLAAGDALLTVWERGFDRSSAWTDFPARPDRFGPGRGDHKPREPGCGDPRGASSYWINFTDSGRHFHAQLVLGARARIAGRRRDAFRILDTLRLDPDVQPSWRASG